MLIKFNIILFSYTIIYILKMSQPCLTMFSPIFSPCLLNIILRVVSKLSMIDQPLPTRLFYYTIPLLL